MSAWKTAGHIVANEFVAVRDQNDIGVPYLTTVDKNCERVVRSYVKYSECTPGAGIRKQNARYNQSPMLKFTAPNQQQQICTALVENLIFATSVGPLAFVTLIVFGFLLQRSRYFSRLHMD